MEGESVRERRDGTGLTIAVTEDGKYLHHFAPKNHLGMGSDVRYLITEGPEAFGDRWFARSVRPLVDDDGTEWLAGYDGRAPDASFGDARVPVCWRRRKGERWSMYG